MPWEDILSFGRKATVEDEVDPEAGSSSTPIMPIDQRPKKIPSAPSRALPKASSEAQSKASLLFDDDCSDFIICTPDRTFNVRQDILRGHSDFFDAAMSNGFKESAEYKVDLLEEDSVIVGIMIWYCYTGIYPHYSQLIKPLNPKMEALPRFIPGLEQFLGYEEAMLPHAKILLAADRLMFASLREKALCHMRDIFMIGDAEPHKVETPDFESSVKLLWGQVSSGFPRAEEMITWMTVHSLGQFDIGCVDFMDTLCLELPEFMLALFKEQHSFSYYQTRCAYCRTTINPEEKLYLMVENKKNPRHDSLGCQCQIRGLCKDECNIGREFSYRGIAHCEVCEETRLTGPTWSVISLVAVGRENGRLKWITQGKQELIVKDGHKYFIP